MSFVLPCGWAPVFFAMIAAVCAHASAWQDEPATVQAAAKVLDLRSFAIPKDAELVSPRRLANLSYQTAAPVAEAAAFVKDALTKSGWQELPGGYSDAQFASGTFAKNSFHVSLSASPSTSKDGKPQTTVSLLQHGNVDFEKLPKPANLEKLYAGPVSIILTSPASVDDTIAQCREALEKAGWIPYSGEGDGARFFKHNAVRLSVYVAAAPAQQDKTSVQYSAELMSVELDPPPDSTQIHYADSTASLHFDSSQSLDDVMSFYREQLTAAGWKATTENPIKDGLYTTLIFGNAAKELLTLELSTVDEITRGTLRYQSPEELAELDKAFAAEADKRAEKAEAMERERAASKIAIPLPKEAAQVEITESTIEFQLPSGKSAGAIKALRKFLTDAGWKEEVQSDEPAAGVFRYELKDASISLTCIDPGFIPAEITVSGSGVTLEKK